MHQTMARIAAAEARLEEVMSELRATAQLAFQIGPEHVRGNIERLQREAHELKQKIDLWRPAPHRENPLNPKLAELRRLAMTEYSTLKNARRGRRG